MKTRVLFISLVLLLITIFSMMSLSAAPKVGLISDGQLVTWDENQFGSIQIRDSRTLIPLRIVSESLGLKVSWDDKNKEALVRHHGQLYRFPVGKNLIIGPTGTVATDVANTIIGNRTYLPLRAFFEQVGYDVDWKSKKKVDVHSKSDNELVKLDSYVIVKTPTQTEEKNNLISRGARSTEDLLITTDDIDDLYHVQHLEKMPVTITDKPEPQAPAAPSVDQSWVMSKINSLYSQYPEGMYWDGGYCYVWLGNHAYYGYDGCGCAGFVLEFSDQIFGKDAPPTMYTDFSNIENTIKAGDIIEVDYGGHQVVVTNVLDYGVEVVEGNYAGTVHWGRVYTFNELREVATFYFSRY